MLRPLKYSARQMRSMADGVIPLARLPVVRQDEVGDMVESFNSLVEKLQESESKMAYVAHHDALTGLPNRRSFMTRMHQSVALAERQSGTLALMFIDLDGFKRINDSHGHKVGDHLLQHVAARLNEGVRQADIVGRFGGDEFMVLLTDCPDRTRAAAVAQKIITRLSEPYTIHDIQITIGASIGIAMFPEQSREAEALIALADTAMYQSKSDGAGRYQFSGDTPWAPAFSS
jgi:diguanylate cyclase (GGDEF)-like protein